MDRILTAKNILMCGLVHGREYLRSKLGEEIDNLLLETFGELHKNNTPQEAFVFLMVKLFNKKYPSVSSDYQCNQDMEISDALEYMKFTSEFREAHRIGEVKEDQMSAVLNDFAYILSKQFFYQPEVYDSITQILHPDE